jgi:formylglycine-generating enzyme required for sulfatase activity
MIANSILHDRCVRSTIGFAVFCATAVSLHGSFATADEIANSAGMKLRLIDAGRFEMGEHDLSPGFYKDHSEFSIEDARPVHPVVVTKPFYLATTEVTVGQFRQFVKETGYETSAETNEQGAVGWDPKSPADNPGYLSTFRDDGGFDWQNAGFNQADDHPVVVVSFADAKAYCHWLSQKERATYRLPTEAEWEYAARAGTNTYFSFGDEYRGRIHHYANIGNVELEMAFADRVRRQWLVDVERDPPDQHVFTAPVGSYEVNPWGLFDMYGNVWEWCEDRYLDTAYSPYTRPGHEQIRKRAIDPVNVERSGDAGDWRAIRGGSWFNAPVQCRSSVRGYFEANDAGCYLGFRVVLDPPEEVVAAARQKFQQSEAARATLERLADRVRERRDGRLSVELNHQSQPLTDEFLAALQQLDEPVDLYLHGHLTATQVAALAKIRQLAGFVISGIEPVMTDDDFAMLADHPELELLHIIGTSKLSDALLRQFKKLERLELLQLDSPGITDEGLASLPPLRHLKTLNIRGTASQGLAMAHFRGSPLDHFSCDQLIDDSARLLTEFSTIRVMSISGSPITGRGLASIARLPRLQRLELSGCTNLDDADFAVLGQAYLLSSLQLSQTAAGDRAATALVQLNHLHELRIGSEHLSDAGVRKLCEIVSLRNLTIAPEAVNLTDAATSDLWRLVNLHSFGVAAPNVTGSGLSTVGELPRLEWMSLEGAGICDVALKHAAESDSLQRLHVGNWQIGGPAALTDAGIMYLAGSRKLTQFDLFRKATKVTDEGVEQLRTQQPRINVNPR